MRKKFKNLNLSREEKAAWLGCFFLSCFSIFQFTLQGSVGIFSEGLKESLDLNPKSLSILSSCFYYSYILMQIPVGMILDRYDIRKVTSAAILLVSLSLCVFALSTNFAFAVFARILMGISCSFGFLGLIVAIGKWFPKRYFAFIVAISESIGMFGVAGFSSFLSQMVVEYDWRIASFASAVLGLLLAMGMFWGAPRGKVQAKDLDVSKEPEQAPLWQSLKTVLKTKEVYLGGLFSFALFSIITVFAGLWGIPFLMASANVNLILATSLISMIYIGTAISSPLIGWLTGLVKMSTLMMGSSLLAGLLMLAVLFASKMTVMELYVLIFFLGFVSAVYQLPFALVNNKVPHACKGIALGITNIICMLSGPILQPIIGYVLSSKEASNPEGLLDFTIYNYQIALLVLPICIGLAIFLALKLREKTLPES